MVEGPPLAVAEADRLVPARSEPTVTGGGGSINYAVLQRQVQAELSRRRLADFVKFGWSALEPSVYLEWSWHHDAICDQIQACLEDWIAARDYIRNFLEKNTQPPNTFPNIEGYPREQAIELERGIKKIQRAQNLIFNVPPGTLKSRILSVYTPAWMWLHEPSWSCICLSANPKVAQRDSDLCRKLVQTDWYVKTFDIPWVITKDASGWWETSAGGRRQAKGLNANIVGERADALLVDDPNDPEKAESEVQRDAVNNRWDMSAENRVNDERISVRIGIQQRTHAGDWTGHMLAKDAGWEIVCIPCEYEPDHPHNKTSVYGWTDPRTVHGESIQPTRFTPNMIAEKKKKLGSYGYAGQYQQRPAPLEGGMFKWRWWRFFRFADEKPSCARPKLCVDGPPRVIEHWSEFDWMIISVDADFKKNAGTSRCSVLCMAALGPDRFVVDNRTGNLSWQEVVTAVLELREKYSPHIGRIIVEEAANGTVIIEDLGAKVPGVIGIKPKGSKEARATAAAPAVESGNVYVRDGAEWVYGGEIDFMTELATFPNAVFDDQVDSFSQAMADLMESSGAMNFRLMAMR